MQQDHADEKSRLEAGGTTAQAAKATEAEDIIT